MSGFGIDTNVLIRYLVKDVPDESERASGFINKKCTVENPGFINHIVLCETVWVLRSAYKYPKSEIVNVLHQILLAAEFDIESSLIAWEALREYTSGKADFSDYLIGFKNMNKGCEFTATLDKNAGETKNFELI